MAIRLKFLHKLLILTVTPVLIAQAGTMLAVVQTAKQDIEASAQQALKVGSAVAEQLVQTRNEQISRNVKLLASDFGLKEVIAIADPESTRSALTNHASRIGANVATVVYTEDEGDTGSAGSALEEQITAHARRVLDDEGELPDVFSINSRDAVYQVYTAEVRAPTPITYLVLGFKVGDQITKPIQNLTDLNVAILQVDEQGTRNTVNTFHEAFRDVDTTALLDPDQPMQSVYATQVGATEFWVTYLPLNAHDPHGLIVLASRKLTPLEHFLKAKDNVIAFDIGLLLLVLGLGVWLSASVSRPLRTLALATRSLAQGEYKTAIAVSSTDEIGELAKGFDDMRKAVSSREKQISHQLMHDPLTGLPNKKHTLSVLDNALAQPSVTAICLIVIKIQDMEHIGSSLGLNTTDELTRETAKTIAAVSEDGHFVSCIDANRFAVTCLNADIQSANALAETLIQQLDLGTVLGTSRITLKSHAGIAHYPDQASTADCLIRYAMIASADAVTNKTRIHCYDPGREAEFKRYLKIVQDLPEAVEQDELKVYFQPKISIDTGQLYGAEALVRWEHPELGFLPPDDFISAAEQSDNIKLLTRYVLRKSIEAAYRWQRMGQSLKVAVNLSARDLLDQNLFAYVTKVLDEHTLPTTQLILEITESSVMEDVDLAVKTLSKFRAAGMLISIDDFGTGHSSLAQLRDLPLDELKIDKSFVSQMADGGKNELLVSTTIELAHSMGLKVVAEGIEDEHSLRRLSHHNCEIAQGYFFSKPLPEDQFVDWIKQYKPDVYEERRQGERPFGTKPNRDAAPSSRHVDSQDATPPTPIGSRSKRPR